MSPASAEGRLADVAGAVLLGGASSRMGRDKAHLAVGGELLAVRAARLLAELCGEVLLVGGEPPPGAPGRPVADPPGPRCALRGLVGALSAARAERVLVVATDLPALTPELLLGLVAAPDADCVAPRGPRGLEPLCALYRRAAVAPLARSALAEGRLALHDLVAGLRCFALEGDILAAVSDGGRALANVNTPADLEAFRTRSGSAIME